MFGMSLKHSKLDDNSHMVLKFRCVPTQHPSPRTFPVSTFKILSNPRKLRSRSAWLARLEARISNTNSSKGLETLPQHFVPIRSNRRYGAPRHAILSRASVLSLT
jgi:hypothetical protein